MSGLCGFSSTKTVLTIGIAYWILSIICTIYTSIKVADYVHDKKQAKTAGVPFNEDQDETVLIITLLGASVTGIFTSPLLLWGTVKRKPAFIWPWVRISRSLIWVTIALIAILIYAFFYNTFNANKIKNVSVSAIKFIVLTLMLTVQIITYREVTSFYCTLREDKILDQMGVQES